MTNTLVNFRASSLPKAEFGKFYTHFLKDFDDSQISLDDEVSVPLLTKARKVLATYSKSQERVDLTQSTAELIKADDERDTNIRVLLSSTHVLETSSDDRAHRHLCSSQQQSSLRPKTLAFTLFKPIVLDTDAP